MKKDVSVVITTCRSDIITLRKCLLSAVFQEPREIIMVNDGPLNEKGDLSLFIKEAERISSENEIVFVSNGYEHDLSPSGSDARASNIGTRSATSTYICKLDHDDMLLHLPDNFSGDIWLAGIGTNMPLKPTIVNLIRRNRAVINGMLCRRDIMIELPFVEGGSFHTDVCFMLGVLYRGYKVTMSDVVSYRWNRTPDSLTSKKDNVTRYKKSEMTLDAFVKQNNIPEKLYEKYKRELLIGRRVFD